MNSSKSPDFIVIQDPLHGKYGAVINTMHIISVRIQPELIPMYDSPPSPEPGVSSVNPIPTSYEPTNRFQVIISLVDGQQMLTFDEYHEASEEYIRIGNELHGLPRVES